MNLMRGTMLPCSPSSGVFLILFAELKDSSFDKVHADGCFSSYSCGEKARASSIHDPHKTRTHLLCVFLHLLVGAYEVHTRIRSIS